MVRAERLRFVVAFASVLLCLSAVPYGYGQAVFGNITGTVTDPSGAAVAGAPVTITDIDRGTSYTTKTTSEGNYTQTHLLAGHYRVNIKAAGFSEFTATTNVQVDTTSRLDARVALGKAESTVEVSGEAPLLKIDRAEVSNTLASDELAHLPML